MRRRIRAGELLYLAGEVERSLEHLEALDTDRLATGDLERALPLLVDLTDLVMVHAAATAIVTRAVDAAGTDPRRRALVLALASDCVYGIRGGRRAAAIEAISCAEAAGPAASRCCTVRSSTWSWRRSSRPRGWTPAARPRGTPGGGLASCPAARHRRSAPRVWSWYTDDLDTARAALQRSIARARDAGEDWALSLFWCYLAATEELAGDYAAAAAALEEADQAAAWYDWPTSPGISSRAASC